MFQNFSKKVDFLVVLQVKRMNVCIGKVEIFKDLGNCQGSGKAEEDFGWRSLG